MQEESLHGQNDLSPERTWEIREPPVSLPTRPRKYGPNLLTITQYMASCPNLHHFLHRSQYPIITFPMSLPHSPMFIPTPPTWDTSLIRPTSAMMRSPALMALRATAWTPNLGGTIGRKFHVAPSHRLIWLKIGAPDGILVPYPGS